MRLLLLLLLLAVAVLLPACSGAALVQPAAEWVKASRNIHDVVAPRFANYVAGDAELDPVERDQLVALVDDWAFLISQGEAAIAAAGGAE